MPHLSVQPLLQEYLLMNGSLPLLSTGQLIISHEPARLQEAERFLTAPTSRFLFSTTTSLETDWQKIVSFVGRQLRITDNEAKDLLNNNALLNKNRDAVDWQPLGVFKVNDGASFDFSQDSSLSDYLPDLSVEKIMRQPASESVITQQIISTDYEPELEIMELDEKDYWWVWAIAILVISVLLILFH